MNWREVTGHPNYRVSDCGKVRTIARQKTLSDGRVYNYPSRVLRQRVGTHGYKMVDIDRVQYLTHRVVAREFVPNPDDLNIVNHMDSNKLNNNAGNLEWTTHSGNIQHAMQNGVIFRKHKLDAAARAQAVSEYKKGSITMRELAEKHEVSTGTISNWVHAVAQGDNQ